MAKIEIVFENSEVYEGTSENIKVKFSDVVKLDDFKDVSRMRVGSIELRIAPELLDLRIRAMRYHDITWVYITSDDGCETGYYVPWDNIDADENTYQSNYFLPNGTMVIEIKNPKEKNNRMSKFVCPFCRKEYTNIFSFSDCVANCRQKKEKEIDSVIRKKEYAEIEFAYRDLQRKIRKYEDKYKVDLRIL